jgi:hypothetical protein
VALAAWTRPQLAQPTTTLDSSNPRPRFVVGKISILRLAAMNARCSLIGIPSHQSETTVSRLGPLASRCGSRLALR